MKLKLDINSLLSKTRRKRKLLQNADAQELIRRAYLDGTIETLNGTAKKPDEYVKQLIRRYK